MCREKRECAELLTLSAGDVTSLDDSVRRLRDDNGALHHQLTEAHDDTALLRQQLLVMDQQLAQAHDKYYTHTNARTHTRTHTRMHTHTHAHTHTHTFKGPFSRTTWMSRYQKGKTNLDLLKQETVSGSGISWAICKSAPCSRQITTPLHFLQARCPSCC